MLEGVKVLIGGAVEAFFTHEAPQALNQIEIGRIRRQKQQFDAQPPCRLEPEPCEVGSEDEMGRIDETVFTAQERCIQRLRDSKRITYPVKQT